VPSKAAVAVYYTILLIKLEIASEVASKVMLSGALVTTAWLVFRLRMEETAYRPGGWLHLY
jgi:hypothetical protein